MYKYKSKVVLSAAHNLKMKKARVESFDSIIELDEINLRVDRPVVDIGVFVKGDFVCFRATTQNGYAWDARTLDLGGSSVQSVLDKFRCPNQDGYIEVGGEVVNVDENSSTIEIKTWMRVFGIKIDDVKQDMTETPSNQEGMRYDILTFIPGENYINLIVDVRSIEPTMFFPLRRMNWGILARLIQENVNNGDANGEAKRQYIRPETLVEMSVYHHYYDANTNDSGLVGIPKKQFAVAEKRDGVYVDTDEFRFAIEQSSLAYDFERAYTYVRFQES